MKNQSAPRLILLIALAVLMFSPMFVLRQIGPFDFWWWMSTNLVVLLAICFLTDRDYLILLKKDFSEGIWRKTGIGLLSAFLLYLLFFVGNYLSRKWFNFAGSGIAGVYNFKGDAAGIRIALLMLIVIGPGEELFWRGYLQRKLSLKTGKWAGFIIALLLYTGVHIFTGNIHAHPCRFYLRPFLGLDVPEIQFNVDKRDQPYSLGYRGVPASAV